MCLFFLVGSRQRWQFRVIFGICFDFVVGLLQWLDYLGGQLMCCSMLWVMLFVVVLLVVIVVMLEVYVCEDDVLFVLCGLQCVLMDVLLCYVDLLGEYILLFLWCIFVSVDMIRWGEVWLFFGGFGELGVFLYLLIQIYQCVFFGFDFVIFDYWGIG